MRNFLARKPRQASGPMEAPLDRALVEAFEGEPEATQPADFQYISVGLPPYVIKEIKQKAAADDTTIRYEILRCISEGGFKVNRADLVPDARKKK